MTQMIIDKNSNFTRKGGASRATPDATGPKKVTGQMEPTPRPWRFMMRERDVANGWNGKIRKEYYPAVVGPREEILFAGRANNPRDTVDAKLICRAVNHHEELLQALRCALGGLSVAALKDGTGRMVETAIANVEKGNDHDTKD